MRGATLFLAATLAWAPAAAAVSVTVPLLPRRGPARVVRGIVARVTPLESGEPASRVWILVLEDLEGSGPRWLRLRVPGLRTAERTVVAAGLPLPRRGDRMVLRLHTLLGDDWLLSEPRDWRPLRPGERP